MVFIVAAVTPLWAPRGGPGDPNEIELRKMLNYFYYVNAHLFNCLTAKHHLSFAAIDDSVGLFGFVPLMKLLSS